MKVSERWLREWTDPPVDVETLAGQLTSAGLEVDSIGPAVEGPLEGVVVAEVLAVEPHPDADRLSLCRVRAGEHEAAVAVVCGAPNVRPGMRVPLARPGARLPGGVRIRRSRIRGVESQGMLCSARELGLGEDAAGILALDGGAPLGADLREHLGLDDAVIDIDLTPNRGDCLSVAGIAREVAVVNRSALSGPALGEVAPAIGDDLPIRLEAPADCPRYVGRIVRGIDPRARTPIWMAERLRRCGVRPIDPVVDVTNYVMLELGQPMHAFDLGTLRGGIRVRRAGEGERLQILDGTELTLDGESLVIADDERAVALAGVMGGLETGVGDSTVDVLLESAWFEPRRIAVEARRRGLHTDASHRFERGVDPAGQRRAAERATALLLEIAGGTAGPVCEAVDGSHLPPPREIPLRAARLGRLLGFEVAPAVVEDVLRRLGMEVERRGEEGWRVRPPSFRRDVAIEADLVEEVARIHGYDRVPAIFPHAELRMRPRPEGRRDPARLRGALVERGYHEAITLSFVDPALSRALDPEAEPLALSNPISADLSVMRTSLWPGLFAALLHNLKRQQGRVRLFETGLVFRRRGGTLDQRAMIGALATGPVSAPAWDGVARDTDFFDVKGDVEALLGPGAARFEPLAHAALHPGQAAAIERDGAVIGRIGVLHPALQAAHKLPAPVVAFELDLAAASAVPVPRFAELSRFPAVRRDIAVVVDEAVTAQAVADCVGQSGIDVLKDLELFDLYRGEGIDSGKKSLALGLTFQDASRTLTDQDVDRAVGVIVARLAQRLGAKLRA